MTLVWHFNLDSKLEQDFTTKLLIHQRNKHLVILKFSVCCYATLKEYLVALLFARYRNGCTEWSINNLTLIKQLVLNCRFVYRLHYRFCHFRKYLSLSWRKKWKSMNMNVNVSTNSLRDLLTIWLFPIKDIITWLA